MRSPVTPPGRPEPAEANPHRLRWWGAALGWAVLTLILLLLPPNPASSTWLDLPGADKLLHAGAFAPLALLLERATRKPAAALLLTALFGAGTELLQLAAPGRAGDPFDWLADCLGAAAALGAVSIVRRMYTRQRVE